jgi:hypothetical protein
MGDFIITMAFYLNDGYEWLIFIPVVCILFCIARFFILNFSLPMFKGKPALIFDDEKLTSFVEDSTIYWKHVVKYGGLTYGYFLFEMANGEIFRIGTKWVEGDIDTIYNYIQSFVPRIS